jgi:hypothetical protein
MGRESAAETDVVTAKAPAISRETMIFIGFLSGCDFMSNNLFWSPLYHIHQNFARILGSKPMFNQV